MTKSTFIRAFAALVACALVLPVVGSSKNPVERPLKCSGSVNTVVAYDGSFAFDNSSGSSVAVAAPVGSLTAAASGNAFTGVWTLTLTAANGDQISGGRCRGIHLASSLRAAPVVSQASPEGSHT